jgi:hypothetical protein
MIVIGLLVILFLTTWIRRRLRRMARSRRKKASAQPAT